MADKVSLKREVWVDFSKVILIYLMIVCHIGVSQFTDTIIVSFHMSAFFIISGYLHKEGSLSVVFPKMLKRLIVPVFFFNILCYLIWCFIISDIPYSFDEYVKKPLLGIILLNPSLSRPMCMPMWFCISLFFAKLLTLLCTKKHQHVVLIMLCLLISCVLSTKHVGGNFMGRIFLGCLFYNIGYMSKQIIRSAVYSKAFLNYWFFLLSIGLVASAIYNGRPSWLNFVFGRSIILFIMASICGTICLLYISSNLKKCNMSIITYLSQNTMTVLGIHLSLFPFLPDMNPFINALLVLIYCIPVIWVLNRFCPVLIGNNNRYRIAH